MSESSSFNSQSSSSSSGSTLLNNPQTDLLTQIANYAWSQAQNVFNLANQAYSRLTGYTDQVIPSLINNANTASQAATGLWNRYQNTFQPIENQLISEAKSYAGPARISAEMGSAEAGQQQAGDQARKQAEQQLEGFGIDPSSGRYADLDRVSRVQTAAAAAGAGRQARLDTEATGRQLRQQAIQIGQQLPGQAANFLNSAVGAAGTAANAANAEANTRANLLAVPNQYLGTAMQLRPPPVGTNSRSQSFGSGQSQSNRQQPPQQQRGGSGGGGGDRGGGNGDVGMAYDANRQRNPSSTQLGGGYGGSYPGSKIMNIPANQNGYGDDIWNGTTDQLEQLYNYGGIDNYDYTQDPYASADYYGDESGYGYGMNYDYTQDPYASADYYGDESGYGYGMNYDYTQDPYASADYYGDESGYGYDTSGSQDYSYDPGGYYGDSYYGDSGGYSYDYGNDYTDYGVGSGGDYSFDAGGGDYGGDYGGGDYDFSDFDMGYAAGGAINDGSAPQGIPYAGRVVPPGASPSGGAQTDDVNAQVNVGEFIIPKDVAQWKGQEFFQNLIKKSREGRAGAQAKGKPAQRRPGPITFRSR